MEEEHKKGTIYEVGLFEGIKAQWTVAIAEIGAGNSGAAQEAERAVAMFDPHVALFVGVAGGIKDVVIGDVVFSTKVYGYHGGKARDRFLPRPDVGSSTYALQQRARQVARGSEWIERIIGLGDNQRPRALVAPIAAGERVVASSRSPTLRFLQSSYSDAVAVEMEGRGFIRAIETSNGVEAGIIRGISDLIDDKPTADATGCQELASANAAAFAFELLSKYDPFRGAGSRGKSSASPRVAYLAIFSATLDEQAKPRAEATLELLKQFSRDAQLILKEITPGSIQLHLEGSLDGLLTLAVNKREGVLQELPLGTLQNLIFRHFIETAPPVKLDLWSALSSQEDWEDLRQRLLISARRMARFYSGGSAEIQEEDLVHIVLMKIITSNKKFETKDELFRYAYTTMKHASIDAFRRTKRHNDILHRDDIMLFAGRAIGGGEHVANPEDAAAAAHILRSLAKIASSNRSELESRVVQALVDAISTPGATLDMRALTDLSGLGSRQVRDIVQRIRGQLLELIKDEAG